MRNTTLWPAVLLLLAAMSTPAVAQDSSQDAAATNHILADCGQPKLSGDALDSCLERVRVREETNPSPELQSLEAKLELRERQSPEATNSAAGTGQSAAEAGAPAAGTSPGLNTLRPLDAPNPDVNGASDEEGSSPDSSGKPSTDPYDEPPANAADEDEPPGM